MMTMDDILNEVFRAVLPRHPDLFTDEQKASLDVPDLAHDSADEPQKKAKK